MNKKTLFIGCAFIFCLFALTVSAQSADEVSPSSGVKSEKNQAGSDGEKLPCVSHRPEEKPTCAAPPLPPQTIEGPGGIFITPVAYLVNPDDKGGPVGKPAVSTSYAYLGEKDFFAAAVSLTLLNRIELSYAFNNFQLGDLRNDIKKRTGLDSRYNHTQLHHFNLRGNLIPEESFELPWMPAITAGVHFKYNENIESIDHRLGGVLKSIGVHDNKGFDFTLVATKMIKDLLPRPLLITAGVRYTEACHIGLLGFSNEYTLEPELSFAQFITDRLLLVGEFKSKPDKLKRIPSLVEEEDHWWTVAFCYIINNHMTASVGYFNPGRLLNETVHNGLAGRLVFEF